MANAKITDFVSPLLGCLLKIGSRVSLLLLLAVAVACPVHGAAMPTGADAEAKRAAREKILDAFKPTAEAWRQSGSRVELSGEADRQRILAEAAVTEKNVDRAIGHYKTALELYPTWPQGQFNLALLCGQTGDYECAVLHMKEYMLLAPDAPDARAAYEKIVVWEDKIENPEPASKPAAVIDPNGGCREVTLSGRISFHCGFVHCEDPVLTLPNNEKLKVKLKLKGKIAGRDGDVHVSGTLCGDTIEIRKIEPAKRP